VRGRPLPSRDFSDFAAVMIRTPGTPSRAAKSDLRPLRCVLTDS
jgi:hypothetical protein